MRGEVLGGGAEPRREEPVEPPRGRREGLLSRSVPLGEFGSDRLEVGEGEGAARAVFFFRGGGLEAGERELEGLEGTDEEREREKRRRKKQSSSLPLLRDGQEGEGAVDDVVVGESLDDEGAPDIFCFVLF